MLKLNVFAAAWQKKLWCGLGVVVGLLTAPAFSALGATLTYANVFSFDLTTTAAGVIEVGVPNGNLTTYYLYGTTNAASRSIGGAIFRVSPDGGAPQTVYQLKDTDGFNPTAGLLAWPDASGQTIYLYGATVYGPRVGNVTNSGAGTLFRVAADGSGYQTLHTFADFSDTVNLYNTDGAYPSAPLITDGVYLYGVTRQGGPVGTGSVFRVKLDGTGFEVLHTFSPLNADGTNSDGAFPSAALKLVNGRLYGVTSAGGSNKWIQSTTATVGSGVIFSLDVDGGNFQTLFNFEPLDSTSSNSQNATGAAPKSPLLYDTNTNTFYGTASVGGQPIGMTTSYGTVFSLTTDNTPLGTTVTTLYSFNGTDGSSPFGNLVLRSSEGKIYGVTASGTNSTTSPLSAYGVVYAMDTTGGNFEIAIGFTTSQVSGLTAGLTQSSVNDNYFYGAAASYGPCTYYGAVFRLSTDGTTTTSPYASCTNTSGGGGSMNVGLLWLLAALGLAPPVRRRLFAFH